MPFLLGFSLTTQLPERLTEIPAAVVFYQSLNNFILPDSSPHPAQESLPSSDIKDGYRLLIMRMHQLHFQGAGPFFAYDLCYLHFDRT